MNSAQRAALENYNYWNDGRVQQAMFSSCWNIVHTEERTAIIKFNEEWIFTWFVEPAIQALADKWIEDREDFTKEYRRAKACLEWARAVYQKVHNDTVAEYGGTSWSCPREAQDELLRLRLKRDQEFLGSVNSLYHELYERAEKEFDAEAFFKEMKVETFQRPDGSVFKYCMRLDTEYQVCGQCEGSGKVVNPSIDAGGISSEDFYDDPDFADDYMTGKHDITCPRCGGMRVESIPRFPENILKAIADYDEGQWESIRESCAERAMGA